MRLYIARQGAQIVMVLIEYQHRSHNHTINQPNRFQITLLELLSTKATQKPLNMKETLNDYKHISLRN